MKILLTPFMILAATGLLLSLIVHVSALLGMSCPFGDRAWALHIGIFVVWVPAVLAAQHMVKDFKQKGFWKAVLRACPRWMKQAAYAFFGYAMLNFIIFIAQFAGTGNNGAATAMRGFSGHWMAFYSMAFAILYSAAHVQEHDNTRRCPNGHPVSPSARFCGECGGKVQEHDPCL